MKIHKINKKYRKGTNKFINDKQINKFKKKYKQRK